jgi:hypothetical protein
MNRRTTNPRIFKPTVELVTEPVPRINAGNAIPPYDIFLTFREKKTVRGLHKYAHIFTEWTQLIICLYIYRMNTAYNRLHGNILGQHECGRHRHKYPFISWSHPFLIYWCNYPHLPPKKSVWNLPIVSHFVDSLVPFPRSMEFTHNLNHLLFWTL